MHLSEAHRETSSVMDKINVWCKLAQDCWNFIGAAAIKTTMGLDVNINQSILNLFSVVFNLWVGLLQ